MKDRLILSITLTPIKILELCEIMWRELARTGAPCKSTTDVYKIFRIDCFACEWDGRTRSSNAGRTCFDRCIMRGLWPKSCTAEDSSFTKWEHAKSSRTRRKYAKIIADYAHDESVRLVTQER